MKQLLSMALATAAASASGSASPGRWSRIRSFCWSTSRPPRSTQRRQARILMAVHPVLPGTPKLHNSSFLDPDRVDNLLEAQI
jgi:hypothetical protein